MGEGSEEKLEVERLKGLKELIRYIWYIRRFFGNEL
jgi:hypothetical protein